MSDDREQIRLEADEGEDLVRRQVAPAHAREIDEALAAIHATFLEEQAAGLPLLEKRWRAWTVSHLQRDAIDETIALAERARREFRAFLLLGVGGSDLAARVIHDCLDDPCHNLLCPGEVCGAPEVHLAGDNFDPRPLEATLRSLEERGLLDKTLINIVSRSGKTPETVAAAMVVGQWLRERTHVDDWRRHAVAITLLDQSSVLYQMREHLYGILPVPKGVGGRFSAASPVGLFALAMTANETALAPRERVQRALEGFERGHRQCFGLAASDPRNVAFRLARWLHLAERCAGKGSLVFYNWADDRFLGDWVTQLVTESIQERGEGLNVIPTRGPTGNHSLLNGIIRGPRDKVVLFVKWEKLEPDLRVPTDTGLTGELADLEGVPLARIQEASYRGTAAEFAANGIPNVTLVVPRRDEATVFQLMRVLMDTIAVKGRLQQLHCQGAGPLDYQRELTYQQDGVEGYKQRTREELTSIRQSLGL